MCIIHVISKKAILTFGSVDEIVKMLVSFGRKFLCFFSFFIFIHANQWQFQNDAQIELCFPQEVV